MWGTLFTTFFLQIFPSCFSIISTDFSGFPRNKKFKIICPFFLFISLLTSSLIFLPHHKSWWLTSAIFFYLSTCPVTFFITKLSSLFFIYHGFLSNYTNGGGEVLGRKFPFCFLRMKLLIVTKCLLRKQTINKTLIFFHGNRNFSYTAPNKLHLNRLMTCSSIEVLWN